MKDSEKETLAAQLRNQLTPLYSLAEMIVIGINDQEVMNLVLETAHTALDNREKIDELLTQIDKQCTA